MQLPYFDVYAPRYRQAQIDKLLGNVHTGIVEAFGLDEAADGTYGGIRLTFSDDRALQMYVDTAYRPRV